MTTRNLTAKFLKLRTDGQRSRPTPSAPDARLIAGGGATSSSYEQARHSLPPYWVDIADGVQADITKIQGRLDDLNVAHRNRLMVRFDDDESHKDQEIDILTRQITKTFRDAEGKLKRIAKTNKQQAATRGAEDSVKLNIQRSLAVQLQELSATFRKSQKEYLGRMQRQKEGAGFGFDLEGGETKAAAEVDMGMTDAQLMEVENSNLQIDERDEEITKIARSIEELATIFKELAVLVIDQGTILDRIDYNMEQVVESTRKGVEELQKTEETMKKGRPLKCIAFLVLLIIALVIILIVKHSK